jgi:hypothetical protein
MLGCGVLRDEGSSALEIENVAGHLEIHFDDSGFEAFMADCFAG